jgi:hypothetical protein
MFLKKVLVLIFLFTILTLCGRQNAEEIDSKKEITIFYGVSSYAMFGAEQTVIDDLLGQFNSLTFEKTNEDLDLFSSFHVSISNSESDIKRFWVDKNGIFWLNGETQSYKISSGSFDYEHLKAIYEDSKKQKKEKTQPDVQSEKDFNKDELLNMVNSMEKPTPEKPNLMLSSNPYDYINAHRDTYNLLVAGEKKTVTIFVDILKNSTEYGLDKYIMAAVCAEITDIGNGENKTWASAKEWLELYEKEE